MHNYPTAKLSINPLLRTQLPRPLSSSSSSSLHGYISNSSCLQTLLKRGFHPTVEHLNRHLLFLSESHRFNSVIHFFPQLESNNIKPNSYSHSFLARALLNLRRFDEAEHLMRKAPNFARSSMWDSLIQGYCVHQRDPEKGFSVLLDCFGKDGILPSSYTFCSLIHSFSSLGMMGRAIEVLELMSDEKVKYPFGNFVCSSVISGFCKIGKPEIGVDFFYEAKHAGALRPNLVSYTALVDALCQSGREYEVCDLVNEMEKEGLGFDVVFFTCWICGYIREGDLVEAFLKHKLMSDKRITGDVISYTTLIDGFSKEWSVEKAGGVLAKMRKEGLKPNLITYTAVILGFCRKGKLEEAVTLFRRIEDMGIVLDEFLYATLIYGACKKGDYDFVFDLLDEMEKKGISPGVITYNIVINGLCKVGRTSKADEFSKGMLGDIVTYTTLLNGYIGEESIEGVLETKKRFEETGLRIDTVMCNILMKASFLVGIFEEAYALYKRMEDIGLTPNAFTYCILIDGFCKAGRIDQALEIFDDFRKASIPSVACYNCIIHGLCKNSMIGIAIDVLIELIQEDLPIDLKVPVMLIKAAFREESAEGVLDFVSRIEKLQPHIYSFVCNEAICLLCKRGFPDLARDVYVMMRWRSLAVTSKSYYLILKKLIHHKDRQAYVHPLLGMFVRDHGIVDPGVGKIVVLYSCMTDTNMGLQFLDKMKKENLVLTLPFAVFEKLVDDGRALDAYKLVIDAKDDYLSNMDVVDYTIIIGGLCKGGYINEALDLCSFARKKGTALNIISYNMIIKGLCRHGRLIEAFRLYDSLERIGLVPSEITYATLIDVLCKERLMLEADKLFQAMVLRGNEPGIHVYNSFIDGYCKIGQLEDALKTLEKVELKGLELDGFTVSALINGYCLKGDMEGALGFFCEFKNRCVLPDFLGFLNLVRGLSTKGRIDEARSVLREMLRSQSVAGLISKVEDSDIGDDSVYNFLVGLCEQGSVKEAIIVLNEIASMYFPASRFQGDEYQLREHNESHEEEIGTAEETEDMMNNETREFKFPHDFDCFYSQVAKLCSTGETQMANSILKSIIG
ncbi:pentatricopeptide repeat-containing protein At5g57250, mitochondrial [Punica granatum]|uniref:Pentatricopeptide repeat-containing protein At5g57250, mitochondrial n=1 Tax=Punica granatum TaxID=22663 RepID=A0A218XHY0_PUNGR|nr:pentatricopeptide repeat-containing protein At5g57250, mitochondrial [Punica granatum]XP_031381953.1 pentatricopeptide repeat-containing protein At5g57250, mitochondrial [Punica granatum]XP_031381954.1 pentatricopeptide repeat-containing protein At5g57250, mitochondrial [Punica granatum]OWM84289.1 hypothetical protein CDL15_Pgr027058 [Punica granatum]